MAEIVEADQRCGPAGKCGKRQTHIGLQAFDGHCMRGNMQTSILYSTKLVISTMGKYHAIRYYNQGVLVSTSVQLKRLQDEQNSANNMITFLNLVSLC